MHTTQTNQGAGRETPAYFAIIPASVRYDKNVPQGAKLLYGEITVLTKKEGYCWAGNEYFARLYEKDERTIRNWINSLHNNGHIIVAKNRVKVRSQFTMEIREIETRVIKIPEAVVREPVIPTDQPDAESLGEASAESGGTEEDSVPADGNTFPGERKESSGDMGNNFQANGKKIPHSRKNFSKQLENSFRINNTSIYNTTATAGADTASADPPVNKTAAAAVISPSELKKTLAAIDPCLILDEHFYTKAAVFYAEKGLDLHYLSWLYEICKCKKPRSFDGLYLTLFFAGNMVEKYKAVCWPAPPPSPPPPVVCPVCGTEHTHNTACPVCGLPEHPLPDEINLFRELHKFPPEKKADYCMRSDIILRECGKDFKRFKILMDNLHDEFGLARS